MIPYIIHVSILLAGCYIFYWFLLRQETFFQLNRSVLLACLIIPLLLPLVSIPASWSLGFFQNENNSIPSSATIITSKNENEKLAFEKIKNENLTPTEVASNIPDTPNNIAEEQVVNHQSMSINEVMTYLYFSGVIIFSLAFFIQLILILAKVTSLQSMKDGNYRIVELVKDEAPYSFWNVIFINPTKYDPETYEQILAHEKIHIDQTHFIDKLLVEIILIAFWFNPFVWLFRKAISNNLEFLTDQSMLTQGFSKQTYQLSLLKVSVPQHPLNLTTNYNQSFLKNRIAMMNMKKSSARSIWKYLFILPFLGFSVMSLNAVKTTPMEITPLSENSLDDEVLKNENTPEENNNVITTDDTIEELEATEINAIENTTENKLWKDQLKKELISNLKTDDLWEEGNHIFKLYHDKIVYDGRKMNKKLTKKYKAIFEKYGITYESNRFLMLAPIVVMSGTFVSDDANFEDGKHIDIFNEDQDLTEDGKITSHSYSSHPGSSSEGYGYGESIARAHADGHANKHAQRNAQSTNRTNNIINTQTSLGGTHVETISGSSHVQTINGVTYISGDPGSVHNINGKTIIIPEDGQGKTYTISDQDRFIALIPEGTYSRSNNKRGRVLLDDVPKWTKNPSTYIGNMKSTNDWKLPDFYKKVQQELIKDEIVDSGEKIKISFEKHYVEVNGWHLTGGHDQKYYKLAKQYNIPAKIGFSMEIENDHLVIISSVNDLQQLRLDILDALQNDNLISSQEEEVQLKITGKRIILNGNDIPKSRFKFYQNLIHEYQITPSPGKEIVINERKKGSLFGSKKVTAIRVGYAYDGSYLGSIMINN